MSGNRPTIMEPSFAKLLAELADHDVSFIVVGGVAVTLHGYVRLKLTANPQAFD